MQTEQEFLENYNINDYDRPSLTTDIVLLALNRNNNNTEPEKYASVTNLQILLIERANHPEKGKWALPGGFCRPSESVYETAKRELYEETNISEAYLELTGVHSEQNRDPRGWIISNSWLGLIDKQKCNLRADTDAWDAAWFHVSNLESKITNSSMNMTEYTHTLELIHETTGELLETTVTETIILNSNGCESIYHTINMSPYFAFDHNEIIVKTLIGFREKIKNDVRPLFDLVPREIGRAHV